MPPSIAGLLREAPYAPNVIPTVLHLVADLRKNGVPDEEWITALTHQYQHLLIISSDHGRCTSGFNARHLPHVCTAKGIAHVLLSNTLHNQSTKHKTAAILAKWRHMQEITTVVGRSDGYSLKYNDRRTDFVLTRLHPS